MELNFVITILDRVRKEEMAALYKSLGAKITLSVLGRGTATSKHLLLNGLTATEKALVATAADAEATKQLMRTGKKRMFLDIPGNGIMLSIPIKSVGGGKSLTQLTDNTVSTTSAKPAMQFDHELVLVVLNEGYSDSVMDAAREAGATGGTVVPAKGTGQQRAEKFMGISLVDEKDMIFIVATAKNKAAIMKAIMEKTGPDTPAGAICFSLPISQVVGLRQESDEEEA